MDTESTTNIREIWETTIVLPYGCTSTTSTGETEYVSQVSQKSLSLVLVQIFVGFCNLQLHKDSGHHTLARLKIQALPLYILTKVHFPPQCGMLKVPSLLVCFSVPVRYIRAQYFYFTNPISIFLLLLCQVKYVPHLKTLITLTECALLFCPTKALS